MPGENDVLWRIAALLDKVFPRRLRVAIRSELRGLPFTEAVASVVEQKHGHAERMQKLQQLEPMRNVSAVAVTMQHHCVRVRNRNEPSVDQHPITRGEPHILELCTDVCRGRDEPRTRDIRQIKHARLKQEDEHEQRCINQRSDGYESEQRSHGVPVSIPCISWSCREPARRDTVCRFLPSSHPSQRAGRYPACPSSARDR